MTLDATKNFSKVTPSTGYNATDVSIVLAIGDGAKLPNPGTDGDFNLTWWNFTDYPDPSDDPNVEIVRATGRTSDTITVVRAQESTLASTKNIAGKTYKMVLGITAKMIFDIASALGSALISFVKDEQVAGVNGYVWTLAHTPIVGSISLYASGPRIIEGIDYTVSGATVTTGAQWPVGSLFADYRK